MEKSKPLPKLPDAPTVSDLVDNDLEVVGKYLDLAKRHDELVKWVGQKVQEQQQEK